MQSERSWAFLLSVLRLATPCANSPAEPVLSDRSDEMTRRKLTTIGFDADDTLWQNEQFYRMTEARFTALLGEHLDAPGVSARLLAAARRNLGVYGFGIKSFMLSMIETAVEVTKGEVSGEVIGRILHIG